MMKALEVLIMIAAFVFVISFASTAESSGPIVNKGDGTITDESTGLMWQKADDGKKRTWEKALFPTKVEVEIDNQPRQP